MLAAVIEDKRNEIAALCRTYRVRALWVFGSVTSKKWEPTTSDIDFLVDLGDYSSDYASRFFSLRRDLETLMDRRVDLLSAGGGADASGWFQDEVQATKVSIYDARSDQLVA
jgi:predicted nucleotidyltransferase